MTVYTIHFFQSSLEQHNFTAQLPSWNRKKYGDLRNLLHSSPALQQAVLAVASMDLDFYKACSVWGLGVSRKVPLSALGYYHRAVASLWEEISGYLESSVPDVTNNAHLLWCTIFLATFEMMHDATGNGFLTHFVGGTTTLAQQTRPQNLRSTHFERTLYDTVRMFEMARAFNFRQTTFLVRQS